MSIWHHEPTIEALEQLHKGTMVETLGIEITEIGPDYLTGRMPVDHRTIQPWRILHGGASVTLAETLGSVSAALCTDQSKVRVVGQEINANHIRAVQEGWVTGTARPVHLGRRSQVWAIEIVDERGKLVCISRLTIAVVAI
ncbi:MAG: hotdog fold thioesterase [Pseudomonadota bacterium]